MRRTILTTLSGAEGRPLAAALACLLLLAALIGGAHTGAMAASDGSGRVALVLCSHDANGSGQQPADPRADLCCVAGCLAHAPALDAPPPSVTAPKLAGGITITGPALPSPVRGTVLINHRQRGPPSFA
jgi:hypothetical protein